MCEKLVLSEKQTNKHVTPSVCVRVCVWADGGEIKLIFVNLLFIVGTFVMFLLLDWFLVTVMFWWNVFGWHWTFFLFFKHVLNKCIFYSAAFDHRVFTVIEIRNISALYFSSNSYLCSNTTICSMCLIWSGAVEALAKVHSLFCGRTVDL